jgi:hypothetical protein
MTIELNVLFKKMQKDDKKEVLEFHILGDEPKHQSELIGMAGGIAVLGIEGIKLSAEFKNIQRDSKKIVLKFEAKGDSETEIVKLYPKAGYNVNLSLEASQMSIDEFYDGEAHEGIEYGVNNDGTVEVANGQLSIDEVDFENPPKEDDLPFTVQIEDEDEDDLLQ